MTRIEKGHGWELRLGRWQDVLADVARVDSVITDPPYSARTHDGQAQDVLNMPDGGERTTLDYASIDGAGVSSLVDFFSSKVASWMCCMTDDVLSQSFRRAFESAGMVAFQSVPCIIPGMTVRFVGDGPSSWAVYLMVGRTRAARNWGTLRGYYCEPRGEPTGMSGSKPLNMMRQIVRDYSRPSDLVCDPYAGSGTTLLAAVMEGRRAIGAEMDEGRFELAVKRLRAGYTTDLFGGAA